jgi:hypothetical protein
VLVPGETSNQVDAQRGSGVAGASIVEGDTSTSTGSTDAKGSAIAVSPMGRVGSTIQAISRSSIIWKPESRTAGSAGAGGAAVSVPSMGRVSSASRVIIKSLIKLIR